MRVLARTRISRDKQESTSIERQRELIENWARDNGHEIVAWAEDLDVSGSLSPFDTPGLGPYLTEPGCYEWDILVAWKLDRLARNSINLHKLFAWTIENDKTLVCISDNIDLSTWVGRMVASVIAGVAEGELEAIKERVSASKEKMRQTGRYGGGRPAYGYKPEKQGSEWRLVPDPEEQVYVQRIFKEILEGKSYWSIAKSFNEEGIPTVMQKRFGKGKGKWRGQIIKQIAQNRAYLGWTMHKDKPVLDPQGKPVLMAEPTVDADTFYKAQEIINQRHYKVSGNKTSPLLGVLECWECGANLHVKRQKYSNGKEHHAYLCKNGCNEFFLNGPNVQNLVYDLFQQELGEHEIQEKVYTPGHDSAQELQEANDAYEELVAYIPQAPNEKARKLLFEQLSTISERIKTLEETPSETTEHWVSTGQTYKEKWDSLDTEGRRLLMVKAGIRVRARQLNRGSRHNPGIIESEFIIPQDLKERLNN